MIIMFPKQKWLSETLTTDSVCDNVWTARDIYRIYIRRSDFEKYKLDSQRELQKLNILDTVVETLREIQY